MGISVERNNGLAENWKCILICSFMLLANTQYGFDSSTMSGFQAMVGFLKVFGYQDSTSKTGWSIDTVPQQLIASMVNIGTIVGVLSAAVFGQFFGRRLGIWVACLVSSVGVGLQVGASTLPVLYVGRVVIGASNAFFFTFSNTYCVEVTPAHLRGAIVSLFGIFVGIGNLLAAIADQQSSQLDSKLAYQIPLALTFTIPLVLSILVFFVPESPRWLLVMNRPADAERSLSMLRGTSLDPKFLKEEYTEMIRGIEHEKEIASSANILDIFKGTDLRRSIICVSIILSHASSGLFLFTGYSVSFIYTLLSSQVDIEPQST
jgi:MFS family permease